MAIEIKMPALSPTMEEGSLAKWLVKEGDKVASGDLLAEIETDKATMEFEAVDEGTVVSLTVPEGTDGVKVGTVIAILAAEGEDLAAAKAAPAAAAPKSEPKTEAKPDPVVEERADHGKPEVAEVPSLPTERGDRIKASPLARRLAAAKGIELAALSGSGPGGRIVRADVEGAGATAPKAAPEAVEAAPAPQTATAAPAAPAAAPVAFETDIPHEAVKLSNMRKVIARRLTEAKQTMPHIYLTVDCNLDALLKLRGELNAGFAGSGIKISVNDLLMKALAVALEKVPDANVSFAGDTLIKYNRVDLSMAVAIEGGLITPIIRDAANKKLSVIATEAKDLAARAREGKLQPQDYQGGTASISNLGMFGIKQFDAVVNPPQATIVAIGAGEKRPVVINDSVQIATMMTATGSFDHRAVDGAVGAQLMKAFKNLVEKPLAMLA